MLNIGIIGAGARSPIAFFLHRPHDEISLVAVADININAAKKFNNEFKERFPGEKDLLLYSSAQELLQNEEIELVLILTPDYCHKEQIILAIEAGKDIFVEKPLAITLEDADEILHLLESSRMRVYVGHNMRHMFFLKKMKELIDDNVIGEVKAIWVRHFVGRGGDIYFKDWHAEQKYSNSLLVHKAVHDFDAIHYLANSSTAVVQAMGGLTFFDGANEGVNPNVNVEDLSMVQMRLHNGVFASYQQCHYTLDYWRNFTIIGTKGRIENFGTRYNNPVIKIFNTRQSYNHEGDITINLENEYENNDSPDLRLMEQFIRFLKEGGKSNILDSRNAVVVADCATKSLRQGGVPIVIKAFNIKN